MHAFDLKVHLLQIIFLVLVMVIVMVIIMIIVMTPLVMTVSVMTVIVMTPLIMPIVSVLATDCHPLGFGFPLGELALRNGPLDGLHHF